ncbi:MAG: hypothetical protein AAF677_03395 [Pseudomonadota bacterium]
MASTTRTAPTRKSWLEAAGARVFAAALVAVVAAALAFADALL